MKSAVVILDEYKIIDEMLLQTMQCILLECGESVNGLVLEDNPFLPHNIMSIYEYCLKQYEARKLEEREVHYVFIDIPELWEVRADGLNGAVFNEGKKMATIYFTSPIEKRNVQRVEWNTESQTVYKIDYYNRYGFVYCSSFLNSDGIVMSKSYYTSEHKEIINVNYSNGVVTLFENGYVKTLFASVQEFELYVLKLAMDENDIVVFTSSKQTQMVEELEGLYCKNSIVVLQNEQDVKAYQEKRLNREENYLLLVANNNCTSSCSVDNNRNEFRISYTMKEYPKSNGSADVFILTASDMLYGIEALTEGLLNVNFHIAAYTLMSPKLMNLSIKDNVYVYPQITQEKLNHLYKSCDYYLDINYGSEVDNAVIKASLNSMLILGYRHLLHNCFYILDECIFEEGENDKLAKLLEALIKDREKYESFLAKQQEKTKEAIKTVLCGDKQNGNICV